MRRSVRIRLRVSLAVVAVLAVLTSIVWFRTRYVPDSPFPEQLAWLVSHARARQSFSGVVLLARHDSVVFAQALGIADSANARPVQLDTPFPLASISKPLTAMLVLQQVDLGRLTLSESLSQVFPELADTDAGRITIHQLLSHSSGIEEVISRHKQRRLSPADLRTAVVTPTKFTYSNTGYVCLGLVIEAVTGLSYEAALERQILDVAKMPASGIIRAGTASASLALGDGGVRAPTDMGAAPGVLDGAGTTYASAPDLMRFARAFSSHALLTDTMSTLMMHSNGEGYGYGWTLAEQDGRQYVWHSGNLPGYSAYLAILPARAEVLVILSNRPDTDVRQLARRILRVSKQHP